MGVAKPNPNSEFQISPCTRPNTPSPNPNPGNNPALLACPCLFAEQRWRQIAASEPVAAAAPRQGDGDGDADAVEALVPADVDSSYQSRQFPNAFIVCGLKHISDNLLQDVLTSMQLSLARIVSHLFS